MKLLQRQQLMILASQLLLASLAFGQNYKVAGLGPPPAGQIPAALQEALQPQGVQVVNDQGGTLVELWLSKSVSISSNPSNSPDIVFGALSEGEFVGMVHFPSQATDFRGQAIKPGFYTVRYGLIPQDGNHMGVNPTRDAFVLSPAAADTNLGTALKFDDLVKLSRQASGTPHPQLLVGAQVNGDVFPSVVNDDQGHWNLQVKAPGTSGDYPIAITVVGKWQG